MTSSWTAHPLLASPRPPCSSAEDTRRTAGTAGGCSRSVRAGSMAQRSRTGISGPSVIDGSEEPQVAGLELTRLDDTSGRIRLWSRRSVMARRGSRRAANDRRRNQHDRWRIVADNLGAQALTPGLTWGFPTILHDL
jgi:hypothetical protein